jgi:hypothetical protein
VAGGDPQGDGEADYGRAEAAWRAQGRYLGAVRRLSKVNRAKVKAIREKKGVGSAIAAAKRIAAKA